LRFADGEPEGFHPVIPATLFSVLLLTVFPNPGVADWLPIVAAPSRNSTDPEAERRLTPELLRAA
jgi:hypothetical protein